MTANGVISIRSRLTRARLSGNETCLLRLRLLVAQVRPRHGTFRAEGDGWRVKNSADPALVDLLTGTTMNTMTKYGWMLVALLSFGAAATAQEFPNEPYDFLLAKLAAGEGRYDEALERMNAVIQKNPADPVLLYERAMMLIEAGRIERAETELRAVTQKN